MKREELKLADVEWIDLTEPTRDDLVQLSEELGLPVRPLLSCLDPEHLPKFEMVEGNIPFVILRCVDLRAKNRADSMEDLTTKVAIFLLPGKLLTIHRLDPEFMASSRDRAAHQAGQLNLPEILRFIVMGTVLSYDAAITELEKKASDMESVVFLGKRSSKFLQEGYLLRRRASIFRKSLQFTADVIGKLGLRPDCAWEDMPESKERATRLVYYADELLEGINSLLNLQVALASQKTNEASYRTNEIVRVLTVFSIFFLPLNFIAGIYGMNFQHMPELQWQYGYLGAIVLMIGVSVIIYVFMRVHGWLRGEERVPGTQSDDRRVK